MWKVTPVWGRGYSKPPGKKTPQHTESWWHSGAELRHRQECTGGQGHSGSLIAVLGQAIDPPRVDELLVSDFLLQESLQLLDIDLRDHRAGHHKHLEHAVNPLQGQALQVGQHGLDICPEQLQRDTGHSESLTLQHKADIPKQGRNAAGSKFCSWP